MERRNQDQTLKSLEIIATLLSALGIAGLLFWGITLRNSQTPEQKASRHARSLGYFLWQIELNQAKSVEASKSEGRGIASLGGSELGTISLDPWGRPYVYEYSPEKQQLFVWSLGPNGINDTHQSSSGFKGDDLGQALDLTLRQ